MIYSTIKRIDQELNRYPEAIQKGLLFLKDTDFSKLEDGQYDIQGKELFVILGKMETMRLEEAKPEAHNQYLDIQCLLEGKESIGFAQRNLDQPVLEDLLKEKDLVLYKNELKSESILSLSEGEYAVFFPEDVHRPLVHRGSVSTVRKAIVKIHMALL